MQTSGGDYLKWQGVFACASAHYEKKGLKIFSLFRERKKKLLIKIMKGVEVCQLPITSLFYGQTYLR